MGAANALNISQQGTIYFDGVNAFSGIDGGTAGNVLTSNGTGVAPSFQSAPPASSAVYFAAQLTSDQSGVTGDGTGYDIIFDSADVNVGSGYNTATGVFTVPVGESGLYCFSVGIFGQGWSMDNTAMLLSTNGAFGRWDINPMTLINVADNSALEWFTSGARYLTAGSTVSINLQVSGSVSKNVSLLSTGSGGYGTYFTGFKVGS